MMIYKKFFLLTGLMTSFLYAQDQSNFLEKCKNTVTEAAQKVQHTFYRQAARLGVRARIGLCHEGPQGQMPALHEAVLSGNKQAVMKVLAQEGTSLEVVDARGITALHWAAFKGFDDIVQCLIERGANVEAADNKGWTPLHYAAERGHYTVVVYLIEKAGAQKSAETNMGTRAWFMTEDRRVLKYLGGEKSVLIIPAHS